MTPAQLKSKEFEITKFFLEAREDTRQDLLLRQNGVPARNGSSGYQLAGYVTLERYYRGDQWDHDEPPGASQRTDNYCAVIVDTLSSLVFDDDPDVSCPTDDPSDQVLETIAEAKESLLMRVWRDNSFRTSFNDWSKVGSLYGDAFIKGPFMEKDRDGKWKIVFAHVENPGSIRPLWKDSRYREMDGFIDETRMSLQKATRLYGKVAETRGIKLNKELDSADDTRRDPDTRQPMVRISEFWTDTYCARFVKDKLLTVDFHNWGFIPLQHVRNSYIPNYPYGKSDIEDVLDPQQMHNRTMNDMANLLRWISTVNLWGKNLDRMEALVAGLSRLYNLPEDGEIHAFEKPGDPYIANTFVQERRNAIINIAGISEAMLSSSQVSVSSGRALAMAFQGTLRKLNPRMKSYEKALENLNENIFRLLEIYFPETKEIINGDYRNEVRLSATILRNIVDTLNKLSAGTISLDTAQKELGVPRPKMEQKVIRKNLEDPILGPQIARQPALLPRLQEGQNQPGENPMAGPGQKFSSPEGAVAQAAQQAAGAPGITE